MTNHPPHRLEEVRIRSGITWRALSARTGIPIRELKEQEQSEDLRLIDLLRWQQALGVPLVELLQQPTEDLAELTRFRAGLVQVMRSVRSLLKTETMPDQQSHLANIQSKLLDLMPELETIRAWPVYGERRNQKSLPRIESQIVATAVWCPELSES